MSKHMYYDRLIENQIREDLTESPVVMITGPRQAGKTTLVRKMQGPDRAFVSFDEQANLKMATDDPVGFMNQFDRVIIDEIQRVPEIFLTIKKSVDDDRRPGRFLLTGSSNVLHNSRMGDSLVGRMLSVTLLPLAQAEIRGVKPTFLNLLFEGGFKAGHVGREPMDREELMQLVMAGGFPESIGKSSERSRTRWARYYLKSLIDRDLRDIAAIDKRTIIPNFLRALTAYSGQLVNYTQLGNLSGLNVKTVKRYISLLEQLYLIVVIEPWYTSELNRVVKTPKLHFLDTALLGVQSGAGISQFRHNPGLFGHFLESFVYSEVLKLIEASDAWMTTYHFRDRNGPEVDFVIEREDGLVAGIEVKASSTADPRDFKGLRVLQQVVGGKFAHGIVLYTGNICVPAGDRMLAVPLSALWE